MQEKLKNIIKKYEGALVIEDIIPHEKRRLIRHASGIFSILFFVIAVTFIFQDKDIYIIEKLRGLCLIFLFVYIKLSLLEAYFYSHYIKGRGENAIKSFEVAKILFYSEKDDLTKGFMFSDVGDEVMRRLGFSEKEVADFLKNRTIVSFTEGTLLIEENSPFPDFVKFIYDTDESLRRTLTLKGIQFKDFLGTVDWVIERDERRVNKERWWSKERLWSIPPLGKNWSYGEVFNIQKYGYDITESGSSYLDEYKIMHKNYVEKLERILLKNVGANCIIISDNETSRMDVVSMLGLLIRDNKAIGFINKLRVFVLNPNLILENTGDKINFERELSLILEEAIKAKNVVLVFPFFSNFSKSASAIGSNLESIITPYLESPLINLVFLDSKEDYNNYISNKESFANHFNTISINKEDTKGVMDLLERLADQIESESKILFTYGALVAISENTARFFDNYAVSDKARDLMIESVPFVFGKGKRVVEKVDVMELIESKTGVPTGVPKTEEKEKLLNLEEILHKRVIGQDEAINAISDAIRRGRSGIRNPDRPIGSFLFLGPTGVGKTETTKALADTFFGSEENISRLDMSEYKTIDALTRLIGSFETNEVGTLVTLLKNRPYGVLLLDEFEKTTQDVINLFLQVLDEGEFSDAHGKKVNAKNNIIIATTNAGSELIWEMFKNGEDLVKAKSQIIDSVIEQGIYKPELLNRFDGVILFNPLDSSALKKIASLMFGKLVKRMQERGIVLIETEEVIDYLISKGSDPKFGARPMNRAIQDELEELIAKAIIKGDLVEGQEAMFFVDLENGILKLKSNERTEY